MKTSLLLAQLALASSTLATQYGPETGFGCGPSQLDSPNWLTLNQNPNLSKSELLPSGWGIATEIPNGESPKQPLTWRINITEAALANALNSSGLIPNARMLNTVYDLSWPGGENLQNTMSTIRNAAQPSRDHSFEKPPQLCATIFTALFPTNVTNTFNETSGDSCIGALGECLSPLLSAGEVGESGCPTVADPRRIPACKAVFEGSGDPATLDLTANGTGAENASFPLMSGGGFFFQSSGAYEEGDTSVLEKEKERLHVMILDTVGSARRAVCSRVDAGVEVKEEEGAAGLGKGVSGWMIGVFVTGIVVFVF